jgi:N-acetylmuramoyl-L-alanine amidase
MRKLQLHIATVAALAVALAAAPRVGAQESAPGPKLTGMRSWSSPAGTRVVLDFNVEVPMVAPDSGRTPTLVIAVPAPGLTAEAGVPLALAAGDSTVTAARAEFTAEGGRFTIEFAPGTAFQVFALTAADDKPYRIVVDAVRPGQLDAEDRRLAAVAAAKKKARTRLVVIDAGHGGDDVGARGPGGVYEKNVTLAVARELAQALDAIPGVRTLLTRDSDFFIPLRERYRIAEKAKADLFVSIHCNSSRRRGAGSGTEVFFLSLKGATDQADQDLADLENAADLVGGVPAQAEDDVVNVLYEVKRNTMLERSQLLAETVLDHIASDRRVESRGIKQAGFAVLKSVEFPSILVETAFINNPREVKLLRDPAFQRQMAGQIAVGVRAYFEKAGIALTPETTASGSGSR